MDVDETIEEIKTGEDLPEQAGELQFETPWQARVFSLVVTLYRDGVFEWNEFQSRLIEEVQDHDYDEEGTLESVYYHQWMTAFQKLLVEKGLCAPGEIERRATEFKSGDRDASEFVVGASGH
jgi:nitrile hydratase accessory protein